MKAITLKDLQDNAACYWNDDGTPAYDLAGRVEENLPATLHEIMCWDWVPVDDRRWVFWEFASSEKRRAYSEAMAPISETYQKAIAPHLEAYEEARNKTIQELTK